MPRVEAQQSGLLGVLEERDGRNAYGNANASVSHELELAEVLAWTVWIQLAEVDHHAFHVLVHDGSCLSVDREGEAGVYLRLLDLEVVNLAAQHLGKPPIAPRNVSVVEADPEELVRLLRQLLLEIISGSQLRILVRLILERQ